MAKYGKSGEEWWSRERECEWCEWGLSELHWERWLLDDRSWKGGVGLWPGVNDSCLRSVLNVIELCRSFAFGELGWEFWCSLWKESFLAEVAGIRLVAVWLSASVQNRSSLQKMLNSNIKISEALQNRSGSRFWMAPWFASQTMHTRFEWL